MVEKENSPAPIPFNAQKAPGRQIAAHETITQEKTVAGREANQYTSGGVFSLRKERREPSVIRGMDERYSRGWR
jgi:hypothetical protein